MCATAHSLEHVVLAGRSLRLNQSPAASHATRRKDKVRLGTGGSSASLWTRVSEHQPYCPDPDRSSPAAAMATSAALSTAANPTQVSQQLPSSAAVRLSHLALTLVSCQFGRGETESLPMALLVFISVFDLAHQR